MSTPVPTRRARTRRPVRWYLVRRWLYAVAIAALGLLMFYGLVTPAAAPLWLALVLALVNAKPPKLPTE